MFRYRPFSTAAFVAVHAFLLPVAYAACISFLSPGFLREIKSPTPLPLAWPLALAGHVLFWLVSIALLVALPLAGLTVSIMVGILQLRYRKDVIQLDEEAIRREHAGVESVIPWQQVDALELNPLGLVLRGEGVSIPIGREIDGWKELLQAVRARIPPGLRWRQSWDLRPLLRGQ